MDNITLRNRYFIQQGQLACNTPGSRQAHNADCPTWMLNSKSCKLSRNTCCRHNCLQDTSSPASSCTPHSTCNHHSSNIRPGNTSRLSSRGHRNHFHQIYGQCSSVNSTAFYRTNTALPLQCCFTFMWHALHEPHWLMSPRLPPPHATLWTAIQIHMYASTLTYTGFVNTLLAFY